MITDAMIEEGLRLDAERTPGEWCTGGIFNPDSERPTQWIWSREFKKYEIAKWASIKDADFIVSACNNYGPLLRELQRLREILKRHATCDQTIKEFLESTPPVQ